MDTKDAEEGSKVEDAAGNSVADEAHLAPSDWTAGIIDNFFDKMFFFSIYIQWEFLRVWWLKKIVMKIICVEIIHLSGKFWRVYLKHKIRYVRDEYLELYHCKRKCLET